MNSNKRWTICAIGPTEKCTVIHNGTDNSRYNYYLSGTLLGTTELEKDAGIYINPTIKPGAHRNKGNQ